MEIWTEETGVFEARMSSFELMLVWRLLGRTPADVHRPTDDMYDALSVAIHEADLEDVGGEAPMRLVDRDGSIITNPEGVERWREFASSLEVGQGGVRPVSAVYDPRVRGCVVEEHTDEL